MEISGQKENDFANVLFDSGASASFIRKDIALRISEISKSLQTYSFKPGDGEGVLSSNEIIFLNMKIKDIIIFGNFIVVEKLGKDVIIGAKTMQFWKIKLDRENEDVLIDKEMAELWLI